MNEENRNNIITEIVKSDSFITALLGGLSVPVIAWTIEFIRFRVNVSFIGVGEIHKSNPLLFLIDLTPFVLVIGAYLLDKRRIRIENQYTTQIRDLDTRINAMAEFAKKIGEGDYHSQLAINTDQDILAESLLIMRDNLLENTKKESEQSWIAEGKEAVSHILRQHNKIELLASQVIQSLVKYTKLVQGAIYMYNDETKILNSAATFAYNRKKYFNNEFKLGYGLIGQCAYEMDYIYRTEIPDDYVTVTSGLIGDQKPRSLLLIPLVTDEKLQGVMEFASIEDHIPNITIRLLKELGEIIARTLSNLKINERTEKLLIESQQMTLELQENEEELR
ncbi:MAG TPA: GAF domain-containing protein, partial [Bacteroidales bacterium]|nr:GAF domain-containing protein [Bacteroidales bacterium]